MSRASRRERLRARERPSWPYLLPLPGMAAAARKVDLAGQAWRVSLLRTDPGAADAVAAARAALDEAQQELDSRYEVIEFTAMAEPDFEQLVAKHPPREGSDDEKYNGDTFPLAAFLACCPQDMPEAEWIAFLDSNVSTVEREEMLALAVAINVRKVSPSFPKG